MWTADYGRRSAIVELTWWSHFDNNYLYIVSKSSVHCSVENQTGIVLLAVSLIDTLQRVSAWDAELSFFVFLFDRISDCHRRQVFLFRVYDHLSIIWQRLRWCGDIAGHTVRDGWFERVDACPVRYTVGWIVLGDAGSDGPSLVSHAPQVLASSTVDQNALLTLPLCVQAADFLIRSAVKHDPEFYSINQY